MSGFRARIRGFVRQKSKNGRLANPPDGVTRLLLYSHMNLARPTPEAAATNGRPTPDPLAEAFSRYQPELLGALFYVVGNADDARDALQDAFVKCWRHRDGLSAIENLKAWIFKVALNAGRDARNTAWRRRSVPLQADGTLLAARAEGPQAALERDEQLERLRDAVRGLRPEEQEVFLLRQNGELTYEEIAQAIGAPLGTVKTRMRLALGKLRAALKAIESGVARAATPDRDH